MEQKCYRATLRFGGSPLHTLQLEVTRHELKLLAYIHGASAIPPNEINFLGAKVIEESYFDHETGKMGKRVIGSEMEEMKRLARKYDTLGDHDGILRGRKYVQDCFKITLDDLEDIFQEVDPVAAAEAAALASEVKAEAAARGGEVVPEEADPAPQTAPQKPPPLNFGGVFGRTESEGVRP